MQEINGKNKHVASLASLAVFRELYNKQTDIYGIISEFCGGIISTEGKYEFNVTEITNSLKQTFGFSIPEAVVITSLGRINHIKKDSERYIVDKNLHQNSHEIETLQQNSLKDSNELIEDLFTFVSEKKNNELSDKEKEKITQSFCSFLMDDSNGEEYSEYISGFVISKNHGEHFRKNLAQIREGVILYSGLTHNNNLNEVGSWKTELTIYLDTEMLFHFTGYNGVLFKSTFDDFFKYVKEINDTARKKLIRLKYFTEVKERVERFFTKAEYIVKGHDKPNPKMTAMSHVIEGCKNLSDVNEKKTDFFENLKRNGITEENSPDISNERLHKHNIIDQKTINDISTEFEFDISENITVLNYISLLRRESNLNNFYNISYILLTGNAKTTKVAWHNQVKKEGNVPLATNLNWITNKFWFKLNKGFSDGAFPKSLDLVTKAQTTLSFILNESIGQKFDELKKESANGSLTEDQTRARLVNLRRQTRKPEDIQHDEITSILDSISEDSIERFIREQEISKLNVKEKNIENNKLKLELEEKERTLLKNKNAREIAEKELQKSNLSSLELRLKDKIEMLEMLDKQQASFDRKVEGSLRLHKLFLSLSFLLYYAVTFALIYRYSWNNMEQWIYIVNSATPFILFLIYSMCYEKELSPVAYMANKRKKLTNSTYEQFNFEISRLEELRSEIKEINEKIGRYHSA